MVVLLDFLIGYIILGPLGSSKRSSKSSLLHTLRKTYAEGKITTQEFEERKRVLEDEFLKQKSEERQNAKN